MVKFIAGVLEQLDLALEHISKREVHNARFGLMMADNALELFLHRFAKDRLGEIGSWSHKAEQYPHKAALAAAQGQHFDAKVRYAKIESIIDAEVEASILSLHAFRNQLHHAGLQHEEILPDMAEFYLDTACRIMAERSITHMSYGQSVRIPDRAKKYISASKKSGRLMPDFADFNRGCIDICDRLSFDSTRLITSLCDHLDQIIENFDICLQIAADGPYNNSAKTRDAAVVDSQIWPLMFSEKGRAFIRSAGKAWTGMPEIEAWVRDNYPLKSRRDPVESWRKRAVRMRIGTNPHAALKTYINFTKETEGLRDAITESAGSVEGEIDRIVHDRKDRGR